MSDWLRELPAVERKRIGEEIKTVQYGCPLGMPLVRKMEKDLWEERVHLLLVLQGYYLRYRMV